MNCAAASATPPDPWALTMANVRLAYALARRFARRNNMLDRLEDLQQEAVLGMYEAAQRFDPTHPRAHFSTWGANGALLAIRRATGDVCAAPLQVSRRAYFGGERAWAVPFDTPVYEEGDTQPSLGDTLPSHDRWESKAEARVDAGRLMARASVLSFRPNHQRRARCPLRDVEAFYRVVQGESGEEIGQETQVSRERVRQLSDRGGALLRAAAGLSR